MTAFLLKMIAVLVMILDHVGAVFFPQYIIFRIIGRIAFPIFAYFIAEGAMRTAKIEKYILTMLGFAFLSEIPFDLAFHREVFELSGQNVLWTFVLALIGIALFQRVTSYIDEDSLRLQSGNEPIKTPVEASIFLLISGAMMFVAHRMQTDYGWYGVAMIMIFYAMRQNRWKKFMAVGMLTLFYCSLYTMQWGYFYWGQYLQSFSMMSYPLLLCYQGKQGKKWKYFFYLFYPLHLLLISLL